MRLHCFDSLYEVVRTVFGAIVLLACRMLVAFTTYVEDRRFFVNACVAVYLISALSACGMVHRSFELWRGHVNISALFLSSQGLDWDGQTQRPAV